MFDAGQIESGQGRTLAVLTSVHGARDGDGFILDIKALEGLHLYARHWPGPVRWLLTMRDAPPSYATRCDPATLPFAVEEVAEDRSDVAAKLPSDAILVASADNFRDFPLVAAMPGRVVFVLEYTLRTRFDILRADGLPWPRRFRRAIWEVAAERKRRRALRGALGLQCNGLPAFRTYAPIAPRPMHYFDTRLARALQVTPAELAAKQAAIRQAGPLRLAFSGRLDRMKGAQFIAPLARALAAVKLDFTFEIFGAGALEAELKAAANELGGRLILNGPIPFDTALVPAMKSRVDLFICPHPQGDPSCTYLETLGCGVPIMGFGNEAWAAMAEGLSFGEVIAPNDVDAMATAILRLAGDRERLAHMAAAAAAFGWSQPFEEVFEQRIAHLRQCAAALDDQRQSAVPA